MSLGNGNTKVQIYNKLVSWAPFVFLRMDHISTIRSRVLVFDLDPIFVRTKIMILIEGN